MQSLTPNRRWFRFRLRTLLFVVTLLGVALGIVVERAERQRRAVDAIERLGGTVWYDFHFHAQSDGTVSIDMADQPPTDWKWRRRALGKHYFDTVWRVQAIREKDYWDPADFLSSFRSERIQTEFTQAPGKAMEQVAGLTHLKLLDLSNSRTTDADLEYVRGLIKLEELRLEKTLVTDAGMEHVRGLKRLKFLRLTYTAVTDDCVEEVQRVLPDCFIVWVRKK